MTVRFLPALPLKTTRIMALGLVVAGAAFALQTAPGFAQEVQETPAVVEGAEIASQKPAQSSSETSAPVLQPLENTSPPTEPTGDLVAPAAPTNAPLSVLPTASEPATTAPIIQASKAPSPLQDPIGAARWLLSKSSGPGQHLTPFAMFRSADIVVKSVILGLVFASLMTWTVWLAKTFELWGARKRVRRAIKVLTRATTLAEATQFPKDTKGVVGRMLHTVSTEVALSEPALDYAGGAGLKERVAAALGRIEAHAGQRISKGTGILATIGSTAPFIGLFGTVWGIMNAFVSIAESNTTNLAVVAPGIAEALLATAIGLVAAIPAVIIYNAFARSVAGYRRLLGDAGERIERLVSRDIDVRAIPSNAAPSNQEGS